MGKRIRTAGDTDQSGVISRLRATCGPGCRCKSCCPTTKCPTGPTGPAGNTSALYPLKFSGVISANEGTDLQYLPDMGALSPNFSERISYGIPPRLGTISYASISARYVDGSGGGAALTVDIRVEVYKGSNPTGIFIVIPAGTLSNAPAISISRPVVTFGTDDEIGLAANYVTQGPTNSTALIMSMIA